MREYWNKIKEKYTALPMAVKASFWFTVCSVFQKGISFITTPIFTRIMSTADYGQVSMYQTWYSVLATFTTLNLDVGGFNNGMIKYPDRREEYISALQGLTSIITVAFFAIYLAAPSFWDSTLGLPRAVMLLMFSNLFLTPAIMFWSARQRFEYKYAALTVLSVAYTIISPIVGIMAVQASEEKGVARIFAFGVLNLVEWGIVYVYNIFRGKCFCKKEYWLFALQFGIPLIPHYLSIMILGQSDRIMIENLCGTSEVAIYSVAYSISQLMNIVTTSVNASLTPWIYKTMAGNKTSSLRSVTAVVVAAVAGVSLLPALIAPEVIAIMAPAEYSAAIWVIPPAVSAVFFTFLYQIFANIEFYYEETRLSAVASVIAALSNVVLNAVFIPLFGFVAAGYTTMASYVLLAVMHYAFMRHVSRKNGVTHSLFDDKKIAGICLAYFALVGIVLCLYLNTAARYACIAAAAIAAFLKRKQLLALFERILNLKKLPE